MTATPQEIADAFAELGTANTADGVQLLLQKTHFVVDDDGSIDFRKISIYKIITTVGLEGWANTGANWIDWYQERPQIRARIINGESEHALDPTNLIEQVSDSDEYQIYSDVKQLVGPLPGVKLGSIIIEEVLVSQHQPFFADSSLVSSSHGYSLPLPMFHVVIDVPEKTPFQYELHGFEEQFTISENGSSKRYQLLAKDLKAVEETEPNITPDDFKYQAVTISTGKSWRHLARNYSNIIEERLKNAELPTPPQGTIVKGDDRQTAINLSNWLGEEIRYTGMELGLNAIIPYEVKTILDRHYGDCKDKALLLVGMLAKAGIKAHVALLKANNILDSNPNLISLNQFNHAIVYIPKLQLWIDPTVPKNRTGILPAGDQDRYALVAAPKTKALIKTPIVDSKANRTQVVRTITLADDGYGDLHEASTYIGEQETILREVFSAGINQEMRQAFQDLIDQSFLGGDLRDLSVSPVQDMTRPVQFSMDVGKYRRGKTENMNAAIQLVMGTMFSDLPPSFFEEANTERVSDFLIDEPFSSELVQDIKPPDFFVLAQPIEAFEVEFGGMTFRREVEEVDGRIILRHNFDIGKRILSAADYLEAHAGVQEILAREDFLLNFYHRGDIAWQEGRVIESLSIFREAAKTYPNSGIHAARLANAFLRAGLGQAAREESLRAIALDPENVLVQSINIWILKHDLIGRHLYPGYDRAGAIKALDSLSPLIEDESQKNDYRMDLAILYEYDQDGFRYSPKADLDKAIDLYREINVSHPEVVKNNLAVALMWSERFQDIPKEIVKLENKTQKQVYTLIQQTVTEGLEKATTYTKRIYPIDQRRLVMSETASILKDLSYFEEAAAYYHLAAKGSENASALETHANELVEYKRWPDISLDRKDPESMLRYFFSQLFKGADHASLQHLFSSDPNQKIAAFIQDKSDKINRDIFDNTREKTMKRKGFYNQIMSKATFDFKGNKDIGYIAKMVYKTGVGTTTLSVPMAFEENGLVMLGDLNRETMGWQIHKFLKEGQLESAYAWLDWAVDYYAYDCHCDDPLGNWLFTDFWGGEVERTQEKAQLAAEILLVWSKDLSISESYKTALAEHLSTGDTKTANLIKFALYHHASARQDEADIRTYLGELHQTLPESKTVSGQWLNFLTSYQQWEELGPLLKSREEAFKTHSSDQSSRLIYLIATQGYQAGYDYINELKGEDEKAALRLYNNLAWYGLFEQEVPDSVLEISLKAVKNHNSLASQHTLATIYATLGRLEDSRKMIHKVIDSRRGSIIENDDWYVFGLIAEGYGDIKGAITAYEKVEKDDDSLDLFPTYTLAQRRLANLNQ